MMRRAELVGLLCLALGCGGSPKSTGTPPDETGGEGGEGGAGGKVSPRPDAAAAVPLDSAAGPTDPDGGAPDVVPSNGAEAGPPPADANPSPDTAAPVGEFPLAAVKAGKVALFGKVGTHTEGPSFRDGSIYFASDGNGLVRADETGKVFKYHPRLVPVGTYLLADGSMLVCDKNQTVVQLFKDGSVGALLSAEDRKRADFCNDVAIDHKGDIFFTNPHAGDIWRLTVAGVMDKVAGGLGYCNGVEVDREGTSLYFSTSGGLFKIALPAAGTSFGAPQKVGPGNADGLAFDVWGNLWLAEYVGSKLEVFDPVKKQVIASIAAGGITNLCFVDDLAYVTIANKGVAKVAIPGIRGFLHPGAARYDIKQMLDLKPVNDPL
jgi:sugar lactone lactonase YvrE